MPNAGSYGLEFSLNYIDYELYAPTSFDQCRGQYDAADAYHQTVPIVRIFGRTEAGQHVCALVHGVFPYMYIEYEGSIDTNSIHANCLRLQQNINVTLATTYRRNPHDDGSTYVADVVVCKAVPFYGLHAQWKPYYKISLLSPKHMSRLSDLFRSGSILARPHQPYESHVPYLLQFMIDYNLYGCNLVRCSSSSFREPVPAPVSSEEHFSAIYSDGSSHSLNGYVKLTSQNVPREYIAYGSSFARKSRSELEVDIIAGSILNRKTLIQRPIHHDVDTEANFRPDPNERLLPSLTELWRDDARRREALGLMPSRSQLPQSNVRQRSNVWNNEQDMKDALDAVLINQAEELSDNQPCAAGAIAASLDDLLTSFESVQDSCTQHELLVYRNKIIQESAMPARAAPEEPEITTNLTKEWPQHRASLSAIKVETETDEKLLYKQRTTSAKEQNICATDLSLEYTLSEVSKYLTKPARLRGGDDQSQYVECKQLYRYTQCPPSRHGLQLLPLQSVSRAFPEPFYSDVRDVPLLARDYTANGMIPKSLDIIHLPDFFESAQEVTIQRTQTSVLLQFVTPPPSRGMLAASGSRITQMKSKTQISQPTQVNGSASADKTLPKLSDSDVPLSVLSIEILAQSRGVLLPNPTNDPICAIFWAFQDFGLSQLIREGCIVSTQTIGNSAALHNVAPSVSLVETELDLVQALVDLVMELDPDAVLSYEMQNSSLGYVEERSKAIFSFSALNEMGRLMPIEKDDPGYTDRWGETHATSVKVSGRHVLNLWRIMRSEMNLLQYTLENVAFHQLRLRIPKYGHADLYRWFSSKSVGPQQRVVKYFTHRTRLNILIIDSQGLLSRVSEQARLLGIDFYSVFSRGSQFKVESLMCRIAKPECYILLSPSKKQVAQQNALECLPLVMEPQSRFYHDPVLVLDFQSLYPSIMIAYNFCYSTCLGKLGYKGLEQKLGVTHYAPDPQTMQKLAADIEIAPNGVLFVKDHRRKSLLAKMLHDLLETRAMVKEGMKLCKNDKAAQKLMHNRQLALKLIANVTYGYTSASFSGRMPCADIADSIVQTGRETLEKAIEFIHNHPTWNAEVVYGDTDSLFVKLPGRTKAEAFALGAQMAIDITKMSPTPVKLKFEKVYLPCILLAKKRYVGFKYESLQDLEPSFDAKGIETVRRDGTPAEQKIEEKALKIMFRTGDLSAVKDFFQQECWKIMTGRCSLHDFCFAKEVKLGSYSSKGVPPPGAVISAKNIASDPRSEPQYGERVSYLVISGASRSRLTDRCVPPEELLLNPDLRLDVEYYITKNIIPPLDRLFCLMGVNVRSWYDEMPRYIKYAASKATTNGNTKTSNKIETFLTSSHCPVCNRELPKPGVCQACLALPETTYYDLQTQSAAIERTHRKVLKICSSCCLIPMNSEVACVSKDCPVYYKRIAVERSVDINMASRLEPLFIDAANV